MSVKIVVADSDTHAGLLHTIIAHGSATQDPLFLERPIMIVHEEQTRRGIAGHINVRPAIFVEIGGDSRQSVTRSRSCDAGSLTDIRKRPIAIVSIKPVPASRQAARPTRNGEAQPDA